MLCYNKFAVEAAEEVKENFVEESHNIFLDRHFSNIIILNLSIFAGQK